MDHPHLSKRQLVGSIIGMQITLLLAAIDQTIVSTAMPKIIADLNGFERYAWVTTAYMLTSTASLPIFGKLSDLYGRKVFMLGAVALFIVASALCGFSGMYGGTLSGAGFLGGVFGDAINQLIFFRGLQGIGGGIIMGLAFAVIADLFPPAERGKYQGLFSAVFALASVIGPLVGGCLTDSLSWRWVFFVNIPIGIAALAILWFAFPDLHERRPNISIDYIGTATLVAWVVPLLLALEWIPHTGFTTDVGIALSAAAIFFSLFIFIESKVAEPIVPIHLFRNPTISLSAVVVVLLGMVMFSSILFLPLYMQVVQGLSATASGSMLMPMSLGMTAFSAIGGQVVSRLGRYKAVAIVGTIICTIGMALLCTMSVSTNVWTVVGYSFLIGTGLGITMPIYTLAVQNQVERFMMGAATASLQFCRSVGGLLGAAVFTAVLMAGYGEQIQHYASVNAIDAHSISLAANPLKLAGQHLSLDPSLMREIKSAIVDSLNDIFMVAVVMSGSAIGLNLLLKDLKLKGRKQPVSPAPADPELILP